MEKKLQGYQSTTPVNISAAQYNDELMMQEISGVSSLNAYNAASEFGDDDAPNNLNLDEPTSTTDVTSALTKYGDPMGGYQPVTITTAIIDPKISGSPDAVTDDGDDNDDDDQHDDEDGNENKGNKKGKGPKPMKVK